MKCTRASFQRGTASSWSMIVATHLHLVLRYRMCGTVLPYCSDVVLTQGSSFIFLPLFFLGCTTLEGWMLLFLVPLQDPLLWQKFYFILGLYITSGVFEYLDTSSPYVFVIFNNIFPKMTINFVLFEYWATHH
jgi:hypothetical protein